MAKIELPYNQLLPWIIARGKTPEDCSKRLLAMEEVCKGFFEKYPSMSKEVMELRKHVHSEYTEWYEILCDITEKLKAVSGSTDAFIIDGTQTEEGKSVNFLGQYSYEPLYHADKMLRTFHKHNLHIVSYCQVLQKQMDHHLPSIKKSIEGLNKELNDYKARKADSIRKLNANTSELQRRLKAYEIDIKEYPFKQDFRLCLKVRLIQEIAAKNAKITLQNYRRAVELIRNIYMGLAPVFKSFVSFQRMNQLYDEDDTMKYIRHVAENGLQENSGETSGAEETTAQNYQATVDQDTFITVIKDDDVPIADDTKRVIFSSNLGNAAYKQLLFGELLQLQAFVRVRVDELQNRSDMANYVFSQSGGSVDENVVQPLSTYKKHLELINETIGLLSGTDAMKALSILKNKNGLQSAAQAEIDIWNRCCNEVTEQAVLTERIEATAEAVSVTYRRKYTYEQLKKCVSELELAKTTVKHTKSKLEKTATDVMETPVRIFGEIDNI
ncbi:hypothetical protein X943_001855 [Babesia divergens]|uniref:CDK5RAP3-like protein n=1 Tax=Babesia divergens TaxID=32595 RepID=A0AAD9GD21_BABDI|nr:hypothetical protein X943_001855 [Babesia divergens]